MPSKIALLILISFAGSVLSAACSNAERETPEEMMSNNQTSEFTDATMLAAFNEGDFAKAFEQASLLAEKENGTAQFLMGFMLATGDGVQKDLERSIYWAEKSAKNGSPDGNALLGLYFYYGTAIPQDKEKAEILLKKGVLGGSDIGRAELQQLRSESNRIRIHEATGEWFNVGKCDSGHPCGRTLQVHANITNTLDKPLVDLSCVVVTTVEYSNGEKQGFTSENLCDDTFAKSLMAGVFLGDLAAFNAQQSDNRWSIQPKETREIRAHGSKVASIDKEYLYYDIDSVSLTMDINGKTPFGEFHSERLLDTRIPLPNSRQKFSLLLE